MTMNNEEGHQPKGIKVKCMKLMVPYMVSTNYRTDISKEIFMIWVSNDTQTGFSHGNIAEYEGKTFFVIEHNVAAINHRVKSTKMSKVICGNIIGFVFDNNWFYGEELTSDETTN